MRPEPAAPDPAQWLPRFGDELYGYALSRVADGPTAEELVQETFVSALAGLAAFRGQASERTWLYVILKRKIIDYYRRRARSPLVPLASITADNSQESNYFEPGSGHWRDEQAPGAWPVGGDEGRGDLLLEEQEFRQVLAACQRGLTPQQQAVFTLRFVEELPADDICRELNISAANYWVIVHRAKLRLRRCLEKNWFQDPAGGGRRAGAS